MTSKPNIGIDSCGYILLPLGNTKQIKDLVVGDIVATLDKYNNIFYTSVKHIIKKKITNPIYVCNINNLIIPIYQPIKYNSNYWLYPSQIIYPHLATFNDLYQIYLECSDNIIVNNMNIYIFDLITDKEILQSPKNTNPKKELVLSDFE